MPIGYVGRSATGRILQVFAILRIAAALEDVLGGPDRNLEWMHLLELVLFVVEDVRHCGLDEGGNA